MLHRLEPHESKGLKICRYSKDCKILANSMSEKVNCCPFSYYFSKFLFDTRSLFYKECSKIMYSSHFCILYSCSLISTDLFVQSFLILKLIFHVFFKKNLLCLQTCLIREIRKIITHFLIAKITICVFFLDLGLYSFLNSIFD